MKRQVYLDHAATTKVSQEVVDYMLPFLTNEYGNPSSIYDLGAEVKKEILISRKNIASALGCEPQNIFFTSGGTESDNWALIRLAESKEKQGKHIITSKIEHPAVINTCKYLEKRGFEVTYLPVDEQGYVSLKELKRNLRSDTILVSIMMANNEIGTIQPIKEIGELLQQHPAVFHTDAVQAFGQIPFSVKECHIDMLSASSHKIYGPKGCGFLFVGEGIKLPAFHHGGKQERGARAGTENVPAIVGMGKAVELAMKRMEKTVKEESKLRDYMIYRLENEVPYCRLNGPRRNRLPNNVNISFQFVEGETIVLLLDMEGICASSGSACAAGQSVASHVLQAIGLENEMAKGALRFTLGKDTTKEDIDYAIEKIKETIEKNRSMNPYYVSHVKRNRKR